MDTSASRSGRWASIAREKLLDSLRQDHLRIRRASKAFRALDIEADPARREALATRVLDELTVHAALEQGFLYPAARGMVEDLVLDEAEAAHEGMRAAIAALRKMRSDEDGYAARFIVLCETAMQHFEQEENELFPRLALPELEGAELERTELQWTALAEEMNDRRESLTQDPLAEADLEGGPREAGAAVARPRGDSSPSS